MRSIQFRQILAVDIDVFIAPAREIRDVNAGRVGGRQANRLGNRMRGFERRDNALHAAEHRGRADRLRIAADAVFARGLRSCSQACSGPTEA